MLIPATLFLTDTVDRKLHQAGVPRRFWHSHVNGAVFQKTTLWGAPLSAKAQRQVINNYLREAKLLSSNPTEPRQNFFAVISSTPTRDGALHLCCALARRLLAAQAKLGAKRRVQSKIRLDRLSVLYLDVYAWSRPYTRVEREPDLVVIHGPDDNSQPTTLELTRTLVDYYDRSVRLLAVAGIGEPEKWCLNRLRLRPDVVFKVADTDPYLGVKS
jgi:hypothetical protein